MKDIHWFKNEIAPYLKGYEIKYKFFENGDFGDINQVELNSDKMGCEIDFWSTGWLSIFVWDFQKEEQLLNIFLEPQQEEEKENAFKRLQELW